MSKDPFVLKNGKIYALISISVAFQCDNCGYRKFGSNQKEQDSTCEKCKKGKMKSKDLENAEFQDK